MRFGRGFIILLSLLLAGLILLAWHEEPKQGTTLSLEISSGSSKEKITCWQSDSGESYFFLPSYGELDEARFRVSGKGTLALDGTANSRAAAQLRVNSLFSFFFMANYHPFRACLKRRTKCNFPAEKCLCFGALVPQKSRMAILRINAKAPFSKAERRTKTRNPPDSQFSCACYRP